MKKIFLQQKLFSIIFTFGFLVILLFYTGKNIPVAHGDLAGDCASLGCEPGQVILLLWGKIEPQKYQPCRPPSSDSCNQAPEWTCTAACPAAPPATATNTPPAAATNTPPAAATNTPPPPPDPPCAKWKGGDPNSGVCEMVATSLFQGKNKSDGDISTDPGQFIVRILAIILSFAGGIALLLIISAGYKIMTSKGKPEAIQQGRDQLISAIVGLVFIIFSFVIFQLVVTDILKIPGIS